MPFTYRNLSRGTINLALPRYTRDFIIDEIPSILFPSAIAFIRDAILLILLIRLDPFSALAFTGRAQALAMRTSPFAYLRML
jgi:hypothetical protein